MADPTRPKARLRIVVLASGRGSNLSAIIDACQQGVLNAEVIAVFSDKAKAGALAIARAAGIAAQVLSPPGFATRADYDQELFRRIDALAPQLIVCAGFMRVLSAEVVAPRSRFLINIHPSLLPRHTGMHTHQRVLDAGEREHGASVHFVIPALDAGPVIAQTRIAVAPGDTAELLATRLLPAEHRLLVASIALFCTHEVDHRDGQVVIDGGRLEVPLLF